MVRLGRRGEAGRTATARGTPPAARWTHKLRMHCIGIHDRSGGDGVEWNGPHLGSSGPKSPPVDRGPPQERVLGVIF